MNRKGMIRAGVAVGAAAILTVMVFQWDFGKKKGSDSSKSAKEYGDSYCSVYQNNYTEDGILYIDSDTYGMSVRYCDNRTFQDGSICVDKTCNHTAGNTSACSAHLFSGGGIIRRGNQLYFFSQDEKEDGVYYLFCSDLTGKNREKLCKHKSMDMLMDVYYHKNRIFYSYCELDMEHDNQRIARVYVYDIEKKKEKLLYQLDKTQSILQGMTVEGTELYISVVYSDATEEELLKHKNETEFEQKHRQIKIIGVDYQTGEETLSVDGTASNRVLSVVQNKLVCTRDEQIGYYALDTKEWTLLAKRDATALYSDSDTSVYYLYEVKVKDGKELYSYRQYDFQKKDWVVLGDSEALYYAVVGDYAYGERYQEGKEKGKIVISKKDFLKGQFENEREYERVN